MFTGVYTGRALNPIVLYLLVTVCIEGCSNTEVVVKRAICLLGMMSVVLVVLLLIVMVVVSVLVVCVCSFLSVCLPPSLSSTAAEMEGVPKVLKLRFPLLRIRKYQRYPQVRIYSFALRQFITFPSL